MLILSTLYPHPYPGDTHQRFCLKKSAFLPTIYPDDISKTTVIVIQIYAILLIPFSGILSNCYLFFALLYYNVITYKLQYLTSVVFKLSSRLSCFRKFFQDKALCFGQFSPRPYTKLYCSVRTLLVPFSSRNLIQKLLSATL